MDYHEQGKYGIEAPSPSEATQKKHWAYFSNHTETYGSEMQIQNELRRINKGKSDNNGNHQDPHEWPTQPSLNVHAVVENMTPASYLLNGKSNSDIGLAISSKRNDFVNSRDPLFSDCKTTAKPNNLVNSVPYIQKNSAFEGLNRVRSRECHDSYDCSSTQVDYDDFGLSTHRPESQIKSSAIGIKGEIYVPTDKGHGKLIKQIFSEKTAEVMCNALGEKGAYDLIMEMNKGTQIHRGRSTTRNAGELNRIEVNLAVTKDHGERLSRSSSLDSSDPYQRTLQQQSPQRRIARPRSQSPHKIDKIITRNLQQLTEGEKDVTSFLRNYCQVTVPKNIKNSYSADEIYRQAFGEQSDFMSSYEHHHYGHQCSEPWYYINRDKSGHVDALDDRIYSPETRLFFDSATSMSTNCYPAMSLDNTFSYPPPLYQSPPFESHSYSLSPHPPISQVPPYSSQGGYPHPQQHSFHSTKTSNSVHYSEQNPGHNFHEAYLPSSQSPRPKSQPSYFYPPPHFPVSYGVPRFPKGVPLHLPPPPLLPQPMKHHGYNNRPPSYSYPSYIEAQRHSLTAPQSALADSQETIMSGGHLKIPHPPHVPPASARDYSHPSVGHRRAYSDNIQGNLTYGEPVHSFSLQRYFSSLGLHDDKNLAADPIPELALNSSDNMEEDIQKTDNTSTFRNATGTSVSTAEGVTQRLNELGVDLDQMKHLRIVDAKNGQETGDKSKGIRYCPECGADNKAYVNWCLDCGEVLIGVEPVIISTCKSRLGNSEEKKKEVGPMLDIGNTAAVEYVRGMGSGDNVQPGKEALKLGRCQSLSNSPVQYLGERKEEVAVRVESGWISNDREQEENGDNDKGITKATFESDGEGCDTEEVKYVYENKATDDFNQIADPVLRKLVIAYRNRQISKESQPAGEDFNKTAQTIVNLLEESDSNYHASSARNKTGSGLRITSRNANHYPDPKSQSASILSHTNELKLTNGKFKALLGKKYEAKDENRSADKENIAAAQSSEADNMSSKKCKKKKKKSKDNSVDIEIFGYEEIRLSRNSSQVSNMNIVPSLNLSTSSDEERPTDNESSDEADNHNTDSAVMNVVTTDKFFSVKKTHAGSKGVHQDVPTFYKQVLPRHPFRTSHQSPPQPSFSQPRQFTYSKRRHGNPSVPVNYQRHWAKSSMSWSSSNPQDLSNPRHRVNSSLNYTGLHGAEQPTIEEISQSASNHVSDGTHSPGVPLKQRPSSAEYGSRHSASATEPHQRPSSAKVISSHSNSQVQVSAEPSRNSSLPKQSSSPVSSSARKSTHSTGKSRPPTLRGPTMQGDSFTTSVPSLQPTTLKCGEASKDEDSPRILCAELHRLPQAELEEQYADKLHAVAKNAYDKFQEMTPRVAEGHLSMWQCLPDEIWLYIFKFLTQGDHKQLMLTCHYFYRLANDETLWKYITVKPQCALTDTSLATIADHRPVSVAMVKCQGNNVTLEGLHYFFKETQGSLKELNICGCSQGALVGSVILTVAAQYCQKLTHLDASFCNVSDEALRAISECAKRLESVCVNGFQAMSDSALLSLLQRHGKSLKILELYACFSLNAAMFRSIGEHCTNLRRLCLGSCNKLTDSAMVTLSTHLGHIEELDLRGCKNLRNDCIRKIVRNCPRIHTLILANCQQISDIALAEIATYLKTTLRVLDVCGCNRISDQGVISLAKNCDRLTSLDIGSTKCTNLSVNQLASNSCGRWLEILKLSFLTGLTEACMVNLIHQCPRLKLIHVFGCPTLKNLGKLRSINLKLIVEGDLDVPRFMHS